MAGPSLRRFIPPDQLLPFRPGLALWIGRGTVVEDTAILRPRPRPLAVDRRSAQLIALRASAVRPLLRENSAVQPAAAGGRAIAGELSRPTQLPPLAEVITVDLAQHLFGVGFALDPEVTAIVVPGEVPQRGITLEG